MDKESKILSKIKSKDVPDEDDGPPSNNITSPTVSLKDYHAAKMFIIRKFVENAIRKKKVFTILGPYPIVRSCLHRRGWVEKIYYNRGINSNRSIVPFRFRQFTEEEQKLLSKNTLQLPLLPRDRRAICAVMAKMGRYCYPVFIWTRSRDQINFRRLKDDQIVNYFPKAEFTTKVGLSHCMDQLQWFDDMENNNFFPRCYKVCMDHEKLSFIENYHMTACISLLKLVVYGIQSSSRVQMPAELFPVVPKKAVHNALHHCEIYIKYKTRGNVFKKDINPMNNTDWSDLMKWYYQLLRGYAVLEDANDCFEPCVQMLTRLRYYWPQIDMDGMNNLWILKPAARSRGEGIKILQSLDEILRYINGRNPFQPYGFVVQKYIERPLLIYHTKFDIRQWFLVTDWNPLTIYWYQDCYMRFCSKMFSLKDRSEAAHLCNNAIQQNYMKKGYKKSPDLPAECMWTLDEFKDYLLKEGKLKVWETMTSPRMKKILISTLQTVKTGYSEFRKNCFELYGADFMITEDFNPWLIEINSNSCMAPTTKVTAKLCANVLDDTIKVVLDRRENKNCLIGRFECICKKSQSINFDSDSMD